MITPSFGLTATERVLPKLALDFTTAALDSRITFTRATGASNPATYVNSSGVLTVATNDQPRFDYDPVTLACKGLLIEESRTNLSSTSNSFSGWVINLATSVSFASSQATSPDGTNNGWKLVESSALSVHSAYNVRLGLTASTAYTYSIYAKGDGSGRRLSGYPSGGASGSWRVNLTTGAVESGSAVVVNAGNGWWRISSVYTTNVGSTSCSTWLSLYNGGGTYQGDGVSGAYVFGEQFELGAFATSYIPTTSAALTRNADVATMTGTNFSDWFNASEGTFVAQNLFGRSIGSSQFPTHFYVGDGTANNKLLAFAYSSSGNKNNFTGITSGASQWSLDGSGTVVAKDSAIKLCASYKTNAILMAVNGNSVLTDATASIPSVNRMQLGSQLLGSYLNGWLQKFYYYPQNFTSAETTAFSK